jgi:diguanylate cyclase (GGDEF)-like protein
LRAVGAALRDSCREYDYVARMGGDEFVLVLPASDCESMTRRIGELRDIGARACCAITGMDGMTMSVGEAFFPTDGTDAEQLLAEADRRMYRAKRAARISAPLNPEIPLLVSAR